MMFNESKSSATCLAVWSKKGKAPYLAIEIGGAGGLKRFCSELISSLRKTTASEAREPEKVGVERHAFVSPHR